MTSTGGMKAVAGYYATALFLENGDLAIIASHDLMQLWATFKRTGEQPFGSKSLPPEERCARNLRLTQRGFLTLGNILYDLGSAEGNRGYIEVLSEQDTADIGALTSGPILAVDVERNDDCKIAKIGKTWWFERYQVEDEVETLLEEGLVVIPKSPE